MEGKMDVKEFHTFRWAHARTNGVLYALFIPVGLVIWSWRKIFEIDLWSQESTVAIGVFLVLCLFVPRAGYKLARHIVGQWYKPEFGKNYSEYRHNEKAVAAKLR